MINAEHLEAVESRKLKLPRYWFEILMTDIELQVLRAQRSETNYYRWWCNITWGIDSEAFGASVNLDREQIMRVVNEIRRAGFTVEINYKSPPGDFGSKLQQLLENGSQVESDPEEKEGEEWKASDENKEINDVTIRWGIPVQDTEKQGL